MNVKREGVLCAAAGVALSAAAVFCIPTSASAASSGGAYVALGDSYTSAPFVQPVSTTAPAECMQSDDNYPHLMAKDLGLSLTDVSCGGATVSDMTQSQYPGVAPQFNALSAQDKVVTLGIGGNDDNTFITAVAGCGSLDATDPENAGAPCKAAFGNRFANNIASDASNIATALQRIHTLAPQARVYVVGYPDILPQQGNCWPQMPLTTGDVTYLNGIEHDLNSMLQQQAQANDATFVDTYTPTIGHDACQSESVRWVEPFVPGSSAFPVHPNAAGEAAMAKAVEAAVSG
ncbi:MAG: SGNH/GDSL hydrolase family protein [Nocardiopsaceae bacterium]|nr:SGNH/GDSL hydrolase family protein [Nocardiopsaceae bacterium]